MTPTGGKRCRKCGALIRRRSVGKDQRGVNVRRWCLADDEGSPTARGVIRGAPSECPRGGYHLPEADQ